MIRNIFAGAVLCTGIAIGTGASATVVSLVGDKDCFGTGDACAEGAASFGFGAVTASGDVAPFDDFDSSNSEQSWTHTYAAGTYVSASLSVRTLGLADVSGPYDVFADGTKIGEFPLDGFGHLIIETFTFSGLGLMSLFNDGAATISFTPSSSDGWAIDYAELTLETEMPAVPLPAGLPMLLAGLGGLGILSRRKHAL